MCIVTALLTRLILVTFALNHFQYLKDVSCDPQVIHNLSMWSANDKSMSYDQVKKDASAAKKDMKLVRLTFQKDLIS